MYVERGGQRYLAEWIEYEAGSVKRTHLAVLRYEATLIPRTKVAVGLEVSRYDLGVEEARAWLVGAGYRIVGEMG